MDLNDIVKTITFDAPGLTGYGSFAVDKGDNMWLLPDGYTGSTRTIYQINRDSGATDNTIDMNEVIKTVTEDVDVFGFTSSGEELIFSTSQSGEYITLRKLEN